MRPLKLSDVINYNVLVDAIKKMENKVRLRDLALYALLVYTGIRLGEALRLKWPDVDFKNKTITIQQLKKRGDYVRVVVAHDALFDILYRYKQKSIGDKLFDMTDRNARYIIYKLTKRFIGKRLRPHAIRHSYATFILKSTKDLEVVRRLLGHSGYNAIKYYVDYTSEDLSETIKHAYESLNQ